jgi:hypothetical protein
LVKKGKGKGKDAINSIVSAEEEEEDSVRDFSTSMVCEHTYF